MFLPIRPATSRFTTLKFLSPQTKVGRSRLWSSFTTEDNSLTIHSLSCSFPYIWLRDSCPSPECIHPSTSQKLHRTSDIPLDISPATDGIRLTQDELAITWSDGHESVYTRSFLESHSSPSKLATFHKDVSSKPWDRSTISRIKNLFTSYEALRSPTGLLEAITQLTQYGLLFVTGVPTSETSNVSCETRTLASYFGEIRSTFYGELWDVKNVRDSRNIAYTNLDLGLHMDLLYFHHPPRYQILHCLRNRVRGGTSVFVDALHAAKVLRVTDPSAFDILASTPVAFHYINDGHHLHREHTTIQLEAQSSSAEPDISYINYSPPFQAPLPILTPTAFYPALAKFEKLINEPSNMYQYLLKEGNAVIFDNRRVLHARTAFYDADEGKDGEANRWLKGCYLEADAIWDRGRMLRTRLNRD